MRFSIAHRKYYMNDTLIFGVKEAGLLRSSVSSAGDAENG
jgi:hypothetical protein